MHGPQEASRKGWKGPKPSTVRHASSDERPRIRTCEKARDRANITQTSLRGVASSGCPGKIGVRGRSMASSQADRAPRAPGTQVRGITLRQPLFSLLVSERDKKCGGWFPSWDRRQEPYIGEGQRQSHHFRKRWARPAAHTVHTRRTSPGQHRVAGAIRDTWTLASYGVPRSREYEQNGPQVVAGDESIP